MFKRKILILLMMAVLISSVFGAPKKAAKKPANSKKAPEWLVDPKYTYADEKYLARTGSGATEEAAKASALAAIAGYFSSQVQSNIKASSKMASTSAGFSQERAIEQETFVTTEMNLIGVNYSEPYFDKRDNLYHICAFIDRDVAWTSVVEPDINKSMNKYQSLYDRSDVEKEEIIRYKYLYRAKAAADELLPRLYFGFLIYPAKKSVYQETIDELLNDARFAMLGEKSIPLYLQIKGDQGKILEGKITEVFGKFGFIVSTKNTSQKYVLNVNLAPNEEWSEDDDMKMVAIYPDVEILLSSAKTGEEFYTWKKAFSKTANFTLEKALQRALKADKGILATIEADVDADYRSKLMVD